jgi:hypothetical protein
MTRKQILLSLLLSLLLVSNARAQTPDAPTPTSQTPATTSAATAQETPKKDTETEKKALVLLDEVIRDSDTLKNTENRIRIKALVGDMLWPHDEKRARALFKESMDALVTLMGNAKDDDDDSEMVRFSNSEQVIWKLRREVIFRLASHDAKQARDFLRATRAPVAGEANSEQPVSVNNSANSDQQMELSLANQIAAQDPKQALEIAEQGLTKGYSYELPGVVTQLQAKDHEAAVKLATDIIAKLKTENLITNREAARFAVQFLTAMTATSDEGKDEKTNATPATDAKKVEAAPQILEESSLRELAEMITAAALNSPNSNQELPMMLNSIMPQLEKYAPARTAQLKRKQAANMEAVTKKLKAEESAEEGGEEESSEYVKYQSLAQTGTIEAILEAAPKAPISVRDWLYQSAVNKATEAGDIERARSIITEHITEPRQRKAMLIVLDQKAMLKAAAAGDIEQTRKLLANIRNNERRAIALTQLAATVAAKGNKKIALQLLNEARSLVNYRAKNFMQMGAQLQVAQAYAALDPERSLAMLEPIIDQLNELVAAGSVIGGFISEEFVKDDEIAMEPVSEMLAAFGKQFGDDLSNLTRVDFDRTRAAAERFQRSEVRLVARLLVVQSVLTPTENIGKSKNGAPGQVDVAW